MGVEKLGHRKIIMQAIRVLFDQFDDAGGGKTLTLDPVASNGHVNLPNDTALAVEHSSTQESTQESSQEKSGTV